MERSTQSNKMLERLIRVIQNNRFNQKSYRIWFFNFVFLFIYALFCFSCVLLQWPSNSTRRSDVVCLGRWQSHQKMKTLCRLLTLRERQSRSRTQSRCLTMSRTTSLSSRRVKRSLRSMSRVTTRVLPGGSGATSWTSSSLASPSPSDSATSGDSPTSATKMEEVSFFLKSENV